MAGAIRQWLGSIGLEQYAEAFEDNDIDVDLAVDLADADLKDLGVASMGHRKRLLRAIGALRCAASPAAAGIAADVEPDASAAAPPPAPVARSTPHADRRQLTVMFCDLADSTALSTRLDPEDYRALMRAYQDACAGIVLRYDGFVARYMGDGVLAYFGWPRSHEDDAERAVNAGLGIASAVRDIALPKGSGEPLAARIGIATGPVIVGDIIGEGASREAAVTGETPNLAARLQQIAAPHAVVVSAATRSLVGELFAYRSLGALELKGIDQVVEAWQVQGAKGVDSRFEAVRGQSLTRFVGREHELALLCDRWDRACGSEAQVLLLCGEAGIGKSRLVQALLEHVQLKPHFLLRFQCSPYDANSALNPIIRHLERAARFQPGDSADVRIGKLAGLLRQGGPVGDEGLALIANLLLLPYETHYPPLTLSPQQIKQRTLDILAGQVFQLAQARPVLFLFEDAHWIDPSSLELLSMIVSRAETASLLVAITQRPEWQAPFAASPNVALLQLTRLGRQQMAEIVHSVAAAEVPDALVQSIIDRTDGIPLFVEEMTRSLVEAGFASAAIGASDIPDTLQASLMARLDRLSVAARELAQVASVVGREVPLALLAHVADGAGAGANVDATLEELFSSQLVLKGGSVHEDRIIFRHALIRDAAYQSLLSSRRRDIHRRIAEALEAAFAQTVETQPELVARHYAEAGDSGRAIPYWRRAGERATDLVANREAVGHYDNALAQLALSAPGAQRERTELQLVLAKGVPLIAATGYASDHVRRNYSRARALSETVGDADSLFASTRGLWNCVYDRAELDHALQLAESLVRSCRDSDAVKMALAQRALGSVQLNRAAFDDAASAFDRCIAATADSPLSLAIRDHGEAPQIIALQYKGWARCVQGRMDEARTLLRRSVERVRELEHPLALAFALQISSIVHLLCRDYATCRDAAAENLAISREHGFVFWTAGASVILGCAMAHLERSGERLEMASQGLHDWQSTGAALHVPTWSSLLADAALRVGDFDTAAAAASNGIALAEANHDVIALAELQRLRGAVAIRRGETEAGMTQLHAAVATAARQGAHLFGLRAATDLARLLGDQGDGEQARKVLAPVLGAFSEGLDSADVIDARSQFERRG